MTNTTDLAEMTVDQLVSSLKALWLKQYDAEETDQRTKLNRYISNARPFYEELKRRGPEAVMRLTAFLEDPNPMVRLKAAKMAYCVAPAAARRCLGELRAKKLFTYSLAAGMSLRALENGTSVLAKPLTSSDTEEN